MASIISNANGEGSESKRSDTLTEKVSTLNKFDHFTEMSGNRQAVGGTSEGVDNQASSTRQLLVNYLLSVVPSLRELSDKRVIHSIIMQLKCLRAQDTTMR